MLNKIAIALFAIAYTANARPRQPTIFKAQIAETRHPNIELAQESPLNNELAQKKKFEMAQTGNDSLSTLGENCRGFDESTGAAFPECECGLVCGGLYDIVAIPGTHCRCMDPFDFYTESKDGDAYQC